MVDYEKPTKAKQSFNDSLADFLRRMGTETLNTKVVDNMLTIAESFRLEKDYAWSSAVFGVVRSIGNIQGGIFNAQVKKANQEIEANKPLLRLHAKKAQAQTAMTMTQGAP